MRTKGEVGQRSRQEDRAFMRIVGEVGGQNVKQETGRQRERVGQESSGKEMDRGGDMMTEGEMRRQEET